MDFFNQTMAQLNITTGVGSAVIAAQINHDKNYAFVEVRSDTVVLDPFKQLN